VNRIAISFTITLCTLLYVTTCCNDQDYFEYMERQKAEEKTGNPSQNMEGVSFRDNITWQEGIKHLVKKDVNPAPETVSGIPEHIEYENTEEIPTNRTLTVHDDETVYIVVPGSVSSETCFLSGARCYYCDGFNNFSTVAVHSGGALNIYGCDISIQNSLTIDGSMEIRVHPHFQNVHEPTVTVGDFAAIGSTGSLKMKGGKLDITNYLTVAGNLTAEFRRVANTDYRAAILANQSADNSNAIYIAKTGSFHAHGADVTAGARLTIAGEFDATAGSFGTPANYVRTKVTIGCDIYLGSKGANFGRMISGGTDIYMGRTTVTTPNCILVNTQEFITDFNDQTTTISAVENGYWHGINVEGYYGSRDSGTLLRLRNTIISDVSKYPGIPAVLKIGRTNRESFAYVDVDVDGLEFRNIDSAIKYAVLYEYNSTYGGLKDAPGFPGTAHTWKNVSFGAPDEHGFDYYFHIEGVDHSIPEMVFEDITIADGSSTSADYRPMYFNNNNSKLSFYGVDVMAANSRSLLYIDNQKRDVTINQSSQRWYSYFKATTGNSRLGDDYYQNEDEVGVYVGFSGAITAKRNFTFWNSQVISDNDYNMFQTDLKVHNKSGTYRIDIDISNSTFEGLYNVDLKGAFNNVDIDCDADTSLAPCNNFNTHYSDTSRSPIGVKLEQAHRINFIRNEFKHIGAKEYYYAVAYGGESVGYGPDMGGTIACNCFGYGTGSKAESTVSKALSFYRGDSSTEDMCGTGFGSYGLGSVHVSSNSFYTSLFDGEFLGGTYFPWDCISGKTFGTPWTWCGNYYADEDCTKSPSTVFVEEVNAIDALPMSGVINTCTSNICVPDTTCAP